ncbi:TetR/AcrR family transcriptional regulator [Vibrio brasiliensis]|jgi:AcrR family transcriptional regulator|uniref:TetR/AcrR family transcriptional regulator n=1 Tax=Vibrio brasiliensis TaxID=170652 RepID=UPI001EFCF4AA|nr:TetR/AcrR family transcriptional regulator [Vibrio brasiliensis]MCG9752227.1 TetR/AcrR family transcriptional regulator [Vibrio brasiliensis]MCG9784072.1 TetR/AcrR family transcriptional regulator [Vibrio brasiliensis]
MDKKTVLAETALDLFYQSGVANIGVNEVSSKSQISKRTLYKYFETKDLLILETLEIRHNRFCNWLDSILIGTESNDRLVENLFTGLDRWFCNLDPHLGEFRGCYFINTSAEFVDKKHPISLMCKKHKDDVREIIANHMVEENETLLDMICLLKEGAITAAYVNHDSNAAMKALMICNKTQLLRGNNG